MYKVKKAVLKGYQSSNEPHPHHRPHVVSGYKVPILKAALPEM